ncbi:hypothetical protein ONS95_007408 [Cadophora gregata]|uniref:uncharacterized protein n=1 Tax=Cadophora gregata TaxID=51156 RepID=UPI0026DD99D8|nr:uncharacterized protein ONS95_007408 [Cadophora gregata]KAK0118517.1 hypothetical protein ONS96_011614 [Cadophora gregata f. sp. sojae]KAK0125775.1 hypothetical protein ONS95_007408 [Cadophora gregata]
MFHSMCDVFPLDSSPGTDRDSSDISLRPLAVNNSDGSKSYNSKEKEKEKKSRKAMPKSRTGCKTCKQRHLKCDEGRPACQRCLKASFICDGYDSKKAVVVDRRSANRELLPKVAGSYGPRAPEGKILLPAQHGLPSHALGTQPQDMEYFQYFQEQTILELCGGFDEPLWNRFILQACQEAPFVRHIALSLAAKGRAEKAKQAIPLRDRSSAHESYALRKYSTSLPQIRQYLAGTSNPDPRMFLVAGLLIFLFEFQQGNKDMATKQLKTTLALFKNMRSIKTEGYTHVHHLDFPDNLEEAVVEMVVRLESHISNGHGEQSEKSLGVIHVYNASPVWFPTEFTSVFQAQRFHNHIQYWGSPNFAGDASKYVFAYLKRASGVHCEIPEPRVVPVEEYNRRLREMKQWGRSFQPLFAKLKATESKQYACGLVLYIQWLAFMMVICKRLGWVLGECSADGSPAIEPTDESVDDLCRRGVRSGEELCANKYFLRCFVFDVGVLPTYLLFMLGTEDMDVRYRITQVLRGMIPRRESVWDSAAVAGIADFLFSCGPSLKIP